jgi:hypothetical protein
VGAEKAYGDLYRRFLDGLHPPAEAIERAYSSRLVRHFYSPEEIARFRRRWADRDPARDPLPAQVATPREADDTL